MTDSKSPEISQVFELLNRWRHLPFYSLETRASPFFALFLRDVLSTHFCTEMHEILIPEFPLRAGTLYNDKEREKLKLKSRPGQSYNVDYVAFAKNDKTAYLVELKTDIGSIRPNQARYLCKARGIGFPGLVEGVKKLAKASNSREKYLHLLHLLSVSGTSLLEMRNAPQLYEKECLGNTRAWKSAIHQLVIDKNKFLEPPKVVFIQPTEDESDKCDFEYIYFKEVADIVQRHGDLGGIFANLLRQWIEKAGSPDPRAIAGS